MKPRMMTRFRNLRDIAITVPTDISRPNSLPDLRLTNSKVRHLMRLGVHVQAAVACGITSKGPWRSAKSPGINQALSLDYLKSEGLYSLRDGWIALHYPK